MVRKDGEATDTLTKKSGISCKIVENWSALRYTPIFVVSKRESSVCRSIQENRLRSERADLLVSLKLIQAIDSRWSPSISLASNHPARDLISNLPLSGVHHEHRGQQCPQQIPINTIPPWSPGHHEKTTWLQRTTWSM